MSPFVSRDVVGPYIRAPNGTRPVFGQIFFFSPSGAIRVAIRLRLRPRFFKWVSPENLTCVVCTIARTFRLLGRRTRLVGVRKKDSFFFFNLPKNFQKKYANSFHANSRFKDSRYREHLASLRGLIAKINPNCPHIPPFEVANYTSNVFLQITDCLWFSLKTPWFDEIPLNYTINVSTYGIICFMQSIIKHWNKNRKIIINTRLLNIWF